MKAEQTPIFRLIERLMGWAIPVIAHLPKALPYQTLGTMMIRDIKECLDAVSMAMFATDPQARLSMIEAVVARCTSIRTVMRTLLLNKFNGTPVVSLKQ